MKAQSDNLTESLKVATLDVSAQIGPSNNAIDSSILYGNEQSQAQEFVATECLQTLLAAQNAIFDEDWQQAKFIADSISNSDSKSPYSFLIRAGAFQAEMFSREEKGDEEYMTLLLDSAEIALESCLQSANHKDSALILYFMGNCHAYRSLWEAKFGSIITAVKQGFRARDSYELGITIDSGLPDLFLGIGAYRYWKSAKSGVLRWSGIVKDERQLGIEQVQHAVENAIVSPDGARSALMWILINEKDYQAAVEIAKGLVKKHPNGATFLWPLAQCYASMNKYSLARDTYLSIRSRLIINPGNQINLLKTDYAIYRLAQKLDDKTTIELVGEGFKEYSRYTPRKTRRLLRDEYRILKRL